MIDLSILPLFFIASVMLVLSPGPDLLLISTYSSSKGFKAGFMLAIGILLAGLVQTLLVAFGLGKLMQQLPPIAMAIKVIGALYLAWLGVNLIKTWYANQTSPSEALPVPELKPIQLMSKGLLNNLLNPKALLFFSLFLPQFTTDNSSLTGQILVLGTLLSLIAFAINTLFSFGFCKIGAYFGNRLRLGKHIDGLLGVIFLGLEARLMTQK